MAFCSRCGKELRDGLKFCTQCGARLSIEQEDGAHSPAGDFNRAEFEGASASGAGTPPDADDIDERPTAPTIVLGVREKKKRSKRNTAVMAIKWIVLCVVGVGLLVGGIFLYAWLSSNPFRSSSIDGVDNEKYTRMLALVDDVRNPNFEEVIEDLLTKSGSSENYSFVQEYSDKFEEILGDEYTEEEEMFCDCCYFVWYTEYQAKRYEWLSENSGLLNFLYTENASSYRNYADTLYDMLCEADSLTDMRNIKTYCSDHEIIEVAEESTGTSSTDEAA